MATDGCVYASCACSPGYRHVTVPRPCTHMHCVLRCVLSVCCRGAHVFGLAARHRLVRFPWECALFGRALTPRCGMRLGYSPTSPGYSPTSPGYRFVFWLARAGLHTALLCWCCSDMLTRPRLPLSAARHRQVRINACMPLVLWACSDALRCGRFAGQATRRLRQVSTVAASALCLATSSADAPCVCTAFTHFSAYSPTSPTYRCCGARLVVLCASRACL